MEIDMTPAVDLSLAAPTALSLDLGSDAERLSSNANDNASSPSSRASPPTSATFPPPKTDKPRPHVCTTCTRSFARLEHLKRHERSHTKEKPFECPECTRCFARRDLLLRHQQKLHLTTTPSAKGRGVRRESTSGLSAAGGRVRKNSIANSTVSSVGATSNVANMRPRANTIGHVDDSALGMLAGQRPMPKTDFKAQAHEQFSMGMLNTNNAAFSPRGMHSASHSLSNPHNLPRLSTQGLNTNLMAGGLRTAPVGGPRQNAADYGFSPMFGPGPTINPAQLHMPHSAMSAVESYPHPFTPYNPYVEDEDVFDWMPRLEPQVSLPSTLPEQARDHSSPSAMSTASQGNASDNMLEGSAPLMHSVTWPSIAPHNMMPQGSPYGLDNSTNFSEFGIPTGAMSLKAIQEQQGFTEGFYPTPMSRFTMSPNGNGVTNHTFPPPMSYSTDSTSMTSSSISGNAARMGSVTCVPTDSITDATRQALLLSLSQPSVFGRPGARKYSVPASSSPLSPVKAVNLPSTADLQRYVSAFIQYFHPHFPFLHIPTLSFDTPVYTSNLRPSAANSHQGIVGGGGCLILAMAAIGALYEFDRQASKELFEAAKKMIQLYLEERRKAAVSASVSSSPGRGRETAVQNTPLWLVQAMLLNVIYGINCADRVSSEIASTHCAALVSLARAAELTHDVKPGDRSRKDGNDVHMGDSGEMIDSWSMNNQKDDEQARWFRWAEREERKRTLYGVFHLCSLLVSGYNHAPALMNSEIQLDLPCDEDLWAADSAKMWTSKGGAEAAAARAIPFAVALGSLLSASRRQNEYSHVPLNHFGSGVPLEELPPSDLRPSTFGCLVLINALHNYIWETRQRHAGRQWTTQETESMHAYIEPALRAWQAAWASNPSHSLERPNPFGCGPLSADSIPLLDLAYVRLFVNLGRSKEAFWQRDWDAMANELATGTEIIQHAENTDGQITGFPNAANGMVNGMDMQNQMGMMGADGSVPHMVNGQHANPPAHSSKRERHLRKAAFYAADSLSMSDKLGVTFADFTSRELPVQSALCAFDCAQVLAEWVATVQERVGRYLGVLGRDEIDYSQVPAIMLLEDEDCKLLEKISDILKNAEAKMTLEIGGMGTTDAIAALQGLPSSRRNGYGGKILMVTAFMLERAAVWPVTQLMSQCLESQATHMDNRAEKSQQAQ